MRGPLLSGPLGSASTLDAVARRLDPDVPTVVIGPLWLGEVLSARSRILLLVEEEERRRARRAVKKAEAQGQRLTVALAGVDLPLAPATAGALLVESASALDDESLARWMATLVPVVRPGGRLLALDATESAAAEARLAGVFLASALGRIVQERPREGVVLTVGTVPPAAVVAFRFGAPRGLSIGSAIA